MTDWQAVSYRILAVEPIAAEPIAAEQRWCAAVDAVITTADGRQVVGGLRTARWCTDPTTRSGATLATDFDPDTVAAWDFTRLLWVGPSARPCLVWSNAEALDERAIGELLRSAAAGGFLAGPDGTGLPLVADLGIDPDAAGSPVAL